MPPEASGLVFDLKRYSIRDGPGIRTTVFLKGCPLVCSWCQNPESQGREPLVHYRPGRCLGCGTCVEACPEGALALATDGVHTDLARCVRCGDCAEACPSESREVIGRRMTVGEVMAEVERDQLFYDESGGGVTISGGEPLSQPEFLLALLRAAGLRGLHRAVDTCGMAREEDLARVAAETELFLFDFKLADRERHRVATGAFNDRILANLRRLCERGSRVRVRIPLVPGVNDDADNLARTAALLGSLRGIESVSLLPFHVPAEDKHRQFGLPWRLDGADELAARLSPGRLEAIAARLRESGLEVAIGA